MYSNVHMTIETHKEDICRMYFRATKQQRKEDNLLIDLQTYTYREREKEGESLRSPQIMMIFKMRASYRMTEISKPPVQERNHCNPHTLIIANSTFP